MKKGCNKKDTIQIIKLRKGGMKDEQISKKLGIEVRSVASHTQEALDAHKKQVKKREVEEGQKTREIQAAAAVGAQTARTIASGLPPLGG